MSVVGSLAAGVAFGLALAAPPGPMNAVIAEESVQRGWTAGFRAGLGAATADATFLVLALVGAVTFVRRFPRVQAAMVGLGGLLMLYFAYGAAREVDGTFADATRPDDDGAGRGDEAGAGTGAEPGRGPAVVATGFRRAFVLALSNPYQIVFWLAVGVGLLRPGRQDLLAHLPVVGADLAGAVVVETGSPAILVGLFVGIGLWIVAFPAALVGARRRVARVAPAVTVLSALVLAGFGLLFCWRAARAWLAL